MHQLVLFRKTEPTVSISISPVYKKIHFKELVCVILVAGKSEICRASQQAGKSGRISVLQFEAAFLHLQEISVFAFRPSTDSVRSTHIIEGDLLYLMSNDYRH